MLCFKYCTPFHFQKSTTAKHVNNTTAGNVHNFSSNEFFETFLPGVWKQSFVQDLIDSDDEDKNQSDDNSEELESLNSVNNTQQDSFLAELSQMFK